MLQQFSHQNAQKQRHQTPVRVEGTESAEFSLHWPEAGKPGSGSHCPRAESEPCTQRTPLQGQVHEARTLPGCSQRRRQGPGSFPEAGEQLPPSLLSRVATSAERSSAPPPLSQMVRVLFSLWFCLLCAVEPETAAVTNMLPVRGSLGPREGLGDAGHTALTAGRQ